MWVILWLLFTFGHSFKKIKNVIGSLSHKARKSINYKIDAENNYRVLK